MFHISGMGGWQKLASRFQGVRMPIAPARPCKEHRCPGLTRLPHGYCAEHAGKALRAASMQSKLHTGNYSDWRKIRTQVLLNAGIPRDQHHLYSVDHRPAYDPIREPDHRKYVLVPMLIPQHNSKTAKRDGGFGNIRR
jgi:hypothetical protein